MKLYSQKDVDKKALKGATICVLGYGSQGRAHALNLKDSGFDVVIGVRKGDSWKKARKDGLEVAEPAKAVVGADLVAMLAPDLAQKALYGDIVGSLKKGATLLFAHGFNIHFKQIKPRRDLDVVLIAPKGPGDLVRRQYQQGRGVDRDAAKAMAGWLAKRKGIAAAYTRADLEKPAKGDAFAAAWKKSFHPARCGDVFLVPDHLAFGGQTHTAKLGWPGDARPASRMQLGQPREREVPGRPSAVGRHRGGNVGLQPVARLLTKCLIVGCEFEQHSKEPELSRYVEQMKE